jgi:hypothetical protein
MRGQEGWHLGWQGEAPGKQSHQFENRINPTRSAVGQHRRVASSKLIPQADKQQVCDEQGWKITQVALMCQITHAELD